MNSILNISRKTFWVLFVLAMPLANIYATHVVGGNLTYECLGGDQYEITLTFQRDCINGIAFDDVATIKIFDGDNDLQIDLANGGLLELSNPTIENIDDIVTANCRILGEEVCVDQAVYTGVVELPFNADGYILSYRRCCRNTTLINIPDPLDTGSTYWAEITPDAQTMCNSQAVFNNWPTIYLCAGEELVFDHSATDHDGDELRYRTCVPTAGGSDAFPLSENTYFPPFTEVAFAPPYSLANMMGGVPLEIDPVTGIMTATPNTLGQFLIGICVDEYRDGVLISSTIRDFEYNVVACSPGPMAEFDATPNPNCEGYDVELTNNSSIDDPNFTLSYVWLFDYPNLTPSSTDENPSHSYTNDGVYTIALIATDGECVDTAFMDVGVSMDSDFDLDFGLEASGCVDNASISVTNNSAADQGIASVSWEISDGTGLFTSSDDSFSFSTSGATDLEVTLTVVGETGCTSSITETVMLDLADFSVSLDDQSGCAGDVIVIGEGFDENTNFTFDPAVGTFEDGIVSVSGVQETTTISYTAEQDGCSASGSFEVSIIANPLGDDQEYTICGSESVVVGTQFAGYNYSSDPMGVISLENGDIIATGIGESVTVTLTASSIEGCTFTQTITLNEMSGNPLDLPSEAVVCEGESLLLVSSIPDGYMVTGMPSTNVAVIDGAVYITNITETTTVTITVTDGVCTSAIDIVVSLGTTPDINLPETIGLCPGETIQLNELGDPNCTYTWMVDGAVTIDNGSISNPTIGIPPATGSGVGTGSGTAYMGDGTVTYTVECPDTDCAVTGTIMIEGYQPPAYDNLPTDVYVCSESTFTIEGYDGLEYTWMADECIIIDDTDPSNPIFTYTGSGTTTGSGTCEVMWTVSSENCTEMGSFLVHKVDDPFEDLITEYTICAGDTIELNPDGIDPNCTYTWMADTAIDWENQQNDPNPTVVVNETTIFKVVATCMTGSGTVTGSGICDFVGCIAVNVQEGPEVEITPNPILICEGQDVVLTANADSTAVMITWKDDEGFEIGTGSTITITNAQEGECFTACATNALGCTNEDTACVEIIDGGDAEIASSTGLVYCPGEEVTLTSDIVGDWTPNGPSGTDTWTLTPPGGEVTYCVTGLNAEGCEVSGCITLTEEINEVAIEGDLSLCSGESTTLTANATGGENYTYQWDFNNATTQSIEVSEGSTYCVTVTSDEGCEASTCVTVEEGGIESCSIETSNESPVCGTCIDLTATAEGEGLTYVWSEDGQTTQTINVCPEDETTYSVTITDEAGCTCVTEITITCTEVCCDPDMVYIPNTFSPNGDGTNDTYGVKFGNGNTCISEYKIMIYNRWGEQVFMSMDMNATWDGTFNGEALNPDVYGYHLTYICDDSGEENTEIGNITILK